MSNLIINPGEFPHFDVGLFHGYLTDTGDGRVWLSLIISLKPGAGHLSRLLDEIWAQGKTAVVPCPFPRMEQIVRRKGFRQEPGHPCDVWVKEASR